MEKIGIGVGIIIKNKENKILMLLRNDDVKKADSDMRLEGTWTLPSGKVKFGDERFEFGIVGPAWGRKRHPSGVHL